MIIQLVVSSLLGGCVIIIAEFLRVKKTISNETSRKILHLAHGLVVAYWAFITTYNFIIIAEVLFLAVVLLARRLRIMQALRNVNRKSWGEIFFPLGIIAIALLSPSKWVFLAAMLHLALADSLAALVGRRFKKGEYYIFGQRKTFAGTGTFILTSLMIIYWLVHFKHVGYTPTNARFELLYIPIIMTLAENYSPYGSDNFTLPVLVVLSLNAITS